MVGQRGYRGDGTREHQTGGPFAVYPNKVKALQLTDHPRGTLSTQGSGLFSAAHRRNRSVQGVQTSYWKAFGKEDHQTSSGVASSKPVVSQLPRYRREGNLQLLGHISFQSPIQVVLTPPFVYIHREHTTSRMAYPEAQGYTGPTYPRSTARRVQVLLVVLTTHMSVGTSRRLG